MSDVHLSHARLVDFGTLGYTTLSSAVLMFLVELLMEDLLAVHHHPSLFLFVLLKTDDHLLEGLLMGLLDHEILDCRVTLLILHTRFD